MSGSSRKPRRCHWYKSDGTPRDTGSGKGCTRYNCFFIHPSDPEWPTAASSDPPRGYDDGERDSGLRGPRKYTNLQNSSSSSSIFPDRKSSVSSLRQSSTDGVSPRKDSYDNAGSSSSRLSISDLRDRDRFRGEGSGSVRDPRGSEKDEPRREGSRSERRLGSRDDGRAEKDDRRLDDKRSDERKTSEKRDSISGTSLHSRLPPPTNGLDEKKSDERRSSERKDSVSSLSSLTRAPTMKPAPIPSDAMPPPPVKPPVPPATTSISQDKFDQWLKRIKELSKAVSIRISFGKIGEEIDSLKRVTRSQKLGEFSDETQRRLKKQLEDAEARLSATQVELRACTYRLVDSDFWPVPARPLTDTTHTQWSDEAFKELRISIMDLKHKVKEMEEVKLRLIKQGTAVSKDNVKANSSASGSAVPAKQPEPMEVDEPRPTKRRRTSEERDQPVQSAQHAAVASSISQTDFVPSKDFDVLLDRLITLEGKLSDVENEMFQFDHNISVAVDDRLEEKFGDLNIRTGSGSMGSNGDSGPIDTGQLTAKFHDFEVEFEQATGEIKELADTMAGMITNISRTQEEISLLMAENEMMKKTMIACEERQKTSEEMLKEQQTEIKALNAALTAYISRPPDPVPPPILPDLQMLTEALRPSIVASIREEIAPMLQNFHGDINQTLVDHTTEITGNVMAKLILVLKTQSAIQEFMERERKASIPVSTSDNGPSPLHVNGTSTLNGIHVISTSNLSSQSTGPSPPPGSSTSNGEVKNYVTPPVVPP
ncbi:hypothetical protein BDY19DRAFT_1044921 [Irpex rosettiformis]|uniref:Uncharacterized protein n=1 Tax=Irpex rosettiformis TaxID=378272 RepID=A0ACB8UH29_9APHY|nr:hypothetical protein BDY19DRAFT_1044921 [Irpex rosettiformis]